MSKYLKPVVDYVSIIDALIEVSRDRTERYSVGLVSQDKAWYVQDARTVGIMVGRQCGATDGALTWMAKNLNKCILITKDRTVMENHVIRYEKITGHSSDTFIKLVPRFGNTFESWNENLSDEQFKQTRYIVVDDAMFTIGGRFKRSDFNKWVANSFHPETFVILIK